MQFTRLCLLTTGAQAATVLVGGQIPSGQLDDRGYPVYDLALWSVNTKNGDSRKVAEFKFDIDESFSGVGVVCGNTFYFPHHSRPSRSGQMWKGIGAVDLTSGEHRDFEMSFEYKSLACDSSDPNHHRLLGVAEAQVPTLSTVLTRIDSTQNVFPETVIATSQIQTQIWGGRYYFTQDGSELWMAWEPGDYGQPWYYQIMDTSSGEVKAGSDQTFSSSDTPYPYLLLPDFKRGLFFTNWIVHPSTDPGINAQDFEWENLKWSDLDVADDRIIATIASTDVVGLRSTCSDVTQRSDPTVGSSCQWDDVHWFFRLPQMCGSHLHTKSCPQTR